MTDSFTLLRELPTVEHLWLDNAAAGMQIDAASSAPEATTSQARREGKMFAAWDGSRFHYPAFQFEPDGWPWPRTSEHIEVLPRDRGGPVGVDANLWVFEPDLAFGGRSPTEIFTTEPNSSHRRGSRSPRWLAGLALQTNGVASRQR